MVTLDTHLEGIVARDEEAFAAWMAGAEHRIRASLSTFAKDVDTESVVQECLFRVWQNADRVRPDGRPDALLRYSIRIARNLALEAVRRQMGRAPHGRRDTDTPPEDVRADRIVAFAELRQAVSRCFEDLPEKPRLAMETRLAGVGAPDWALARTVRMTVNTFCQNIRRARLAMADCLRNRGFDVGYRS